MIEDTSQRASISATMDAANLAKVKGQMHSFAMGEAMAQAAQDYQQVGLGEMGL